MTHKGTNDEAWQEVSIKRRFTYSIKCPACDYVMFFTAERVLKFLEHNLSRILYVCGDVNCEHHFIMNLKHISLEELKK